MGNNDVSKKANLQKDWNCPWVSKDGSRLKQAIRYVDEPVAQASTSHQHYYSQPGSILAPEPQISKEQLEETLRQEMSSQCEYDEEEEETECISSPTDEHTQSVAGDCHEREEDSQAPPELEPINLGYEQFQQQSMGGFGQETGYEPSADELIDVLKNLENLAAADPQLYRTIVDQIKVANITDSGRETPNYERSSEANGKVSALLAKTVREAKITKN